MTLRRMLVPPPSHIVSDVLVVSNATNPIIETGSDAQPELPELDTEGLAIMGLWGAGTYRNVENPLMEAYNGIHALGLKLSNEGLIDRATALEVDKFIPGFYEDNGGGSKFSYTPSLEGLVNATIAIDAELLNQIKNGFKKLADWAVAIYNKFAGWIDKFIERMRNSGNASNSNVMSEINEKNKSVFDSGEKACAMLDEIIASPDKVVELMFAGTTESMTELTPEQENSIARAKEILKQQFTELAARAEDFKKALASSTYGKKVFGAVTDQGMPDATQIEVSAAGAVKIAETLQKVYQADNKVVLEQALSVLRDQAVAVGQSVKNEANTGDSSSFDLSKHTISAIHKQIKEHVTKDSGAADVGTLKGILSTVQSVKAATEGISKGITQFSERLTAMPDVDKDFLEAAQSQVRAAISLNMSLINAVIAHVNDISNNTSGKVTVISNMVKLINAIGAVLARAKGPLSENARKIYVGNALKHYGIGLGSVGEKPEQA